jgi:pimeloyl-ACP methyl ester carboxylesterase
MAGIGRTLEREGFHVLNLGWPSREAGLLEQVDRLAARLDAEALAAAADPAPVHFVTHSAGGILTRAFLAEHPGVPVGRVVQLAPPNGGSRLAGELERRSRLFEEAFGPLGPDLARVDLPPPTYELGVIAGDHSWLPSSLWIPGEDDGVVGVEETRAPGMADHLVVPRTHSFIMHSRVVQRQVLAFLRRGRFDEESGDGSSSRSSPIRRL